MLSEAKHLGSLIHVVVKHEILRLRAQNDTSPATRMGRGTALEVIDVMDRIRELTGIYGFGFRKESVAGLILPIAFVVIIGGLWAALIFFL
jgi:hypothetical protein